MYGLLDSVSSGPVDSRISKNSTMVRSGFYILICYADGHTCILNSWNSFISVGVYMYPLPANLAPAGKGAYSSTMMLCNPHIKTSSTYTFGTVVF